MASRRCGDEAQQFSAGGLRGRAIGPAQNNVLEAEPQQQQTKKQ
jgi:hypothetical protein